MGEGDQVALMASTRRRTAAARRMVDATAAASQFGMSMPMSVSNRARLAAALAEGGREGDYVTKVLADRAGHREAHDCADNLRPAKSQVGGAAQVARMTQEEVMAAVILDNDRAGQKYRAFLGTKVKMFQTFCDTVRPQDGVHLLREITAFVAGFN